MKRSSLTLTTRSPSETEALGARLGQLLRGGEALILSGPLGSGKTCLIRGIAGGLGIPPEAVSSPTFTWHHEHKGRIILHHLDLFRADHPEQAEDIGLAELLEDRHAAIVVEWGEKVAHLLPEERLTIRISHHGPDTRQFVMEASGRIYRELLEQLTEEPA